MINHHGVVTWTPLTAETLSRVPGTVGVYEIADAEGAVVSIGYAGARETFGLRSALQRWLDRPGSWLFCHEVTTAYLTRHRELELTHRARFGDLPRSPDERGNLPTQQREQRDRPSEETP